MRVQNVPPRKKTCTYCTLPIDSNAYIADDRGAFCDVKCSYLYGNETEEIVKPSDAQATRHACGVRFDLIPGDALAEVARTLANGAKKYGDNNWKESRMVGENGPINHALKHIHYYNAGIEDDESPDPNIHLANAITNLLFELHYNLNGR